MIKDENLCPPRPCRHGYLSSQGSLHLPLTCHLVMPRMKCSCFHSCFFFFCDWFRVYVETYLNSCLVQVTCLLKSLLKNLKPYANWAYFFRYRCQMLQKITGCGHRREPSICTCLKGGWRAKAGVIYRLIVVSPKLEYS